MGLQLVVARVDAGQRLTGAKRRASTAWFSTPATSAALGQLSTTLDTIHQTVVLAKSNAPTGMARKPGKSGWDHPSTR